MSMNNFKSLLSALMQRVGVGEMESSQNALNEIFQLYGKVDHADRENLQDKLRELLVDNREGVSSRAAYALEKSFRDGNILASEAISWQLHALERMVAQNEVGSISLNSLTKSLIKICARMNEIEKYNENEALFAMVFDIDAISSTCMLNSVIEHIVLESLEPLIAVKLMSGLLSSVLLRSKHERQHDHIISKISSLSLDSSQYVTFLSLICIQIQIMRYCPMDTYTRMDKLVSWCSSLFNSALLIDDFIGWTVAASQIRWLLCSVFLPQMRQYEYPTDAAILILWRIASVEPFLLLADVSFLGVLVLQAKTISERSLSMQVLLKVSQAYAESTDNVLESYKISGRCLIWSFETCVYPLIAISAFGDAVSSECLKRVNYCIEKLSTSASKGGIFEFPEISYICLPHEPSSEIGCAVWIFASVDDDKDKKYVECCKQTMDIFAKLMDIETNKEFKNEIADSDMSLLKCEETFMILSPLLLRKCPYGRKASLQAGIQLCTTHPVVAAKILPFFLHTLSRWYDTPELQVELLHGLPKLGKHKVVAKQVWGVIKGLFASEQIENVCMALRMAFKLFEVNSRMKSKLLGLVHKCIGKNKSDSIRLGAVATVCDLCIHDPEEGVEFVSYLQQAMQDKLPGVVALALKAIAALTRADCLDFSLALRIVRKKGMVSFLDSGISSGNPLVTKALAELGGSYCIDAPVGSDQSADESNPSLNSETVAAINLLWEITEHESDSVRAMAYKGIGRYTKLVMTADQEDTLYPADAFKARLAQAFYTETSHVALAAIVEAGQVVVCEECNDSSIWFSTEKTSQPKTATRGSQAVVKTGPSNALLAILPKGIDILEQYQAGARSGCKEGLAGAVLWSYPDFSTWQNALKQNTEALCIIRDKVSRLLDDLLLDDDISKLSNGSMLEIAMFILGIHRYVSKLLDICIAIANSEERAGIIECRRILETSCTTEQHRDMVMACLGQICSSEYQHFELSSELHPKYLAKLKKSLAVGHTDTLLSLQSALISSALPLSGVQSVVEAQKLLLQCADQSLEKRKRVLGGDCIVHVTCASVGIITEWTYIHMQASESTDIIMEGSRWVLKILKNYVTGVDFDLLDQFASNTIPRRIITWQELVLSAGDHVPSSQTEDITGLLLGLQSIIIGLSKIGNKRCVLQWYHIVRALMKVGLLGANSAYPAAVLGCIYCDILEMEDAMLALNSLIESLNESTDGDASVGAAGLVLVLDSQLVLPSTLVEDLFKKLRSKINNPEIFKTSATSDETYAISALVILSSCPLVTYPHFSSTSTRILTSINRRMIQSSIEDLRSHSTDSHSSRTKRICQKALGCLSAIRYDYEAQKYRNLIGRVLRPKAELSALSLKLPSENSFIFQLSTGLLNIVGASTKDGGCAIKCEALFCHYTLSALSNENLRISGISMVTLLSYLFGSSTWKSRINDEINYVRCAILNFALKLAKKGNRTRVFADFVAGIIVEQYEVLSNSEELVDILAMNFHVLYSGSEANHLLIETVTKLWSLCLTYALKKCAITANFFASICKMMTGLSNESDQKMLQTFLTGSILPDTLRKFDLGNADYTYIFENLVKCLGQLSPQICTQILTELLVTDPTHSLYISFVLAQKNFWSWEPTSSLLCKSIQYLSTAKSSDIHNYDALQRRLVLAFRSAPKECRLNWLILSLEQLFANQSKCLHSEIQTISAVLLGWKYSSISENLRAISTKKCASFALNHVWPSFFVHACNNWKNCDTELLSVLSKLTTEGKMSRSRSIVLSMVLCSCRDSNVVQSDRAPKFSISASKFACEAGLETIKYLEKMHA